MPTTDFSPNCAESKAAVAIPAKAEIPFDPGEVNKSEFSLAMGQAWIVACARSSRKDPRGLEPSLCRDATVGYFLAQKNSPLYLAPMLPPS